LTNGPDLKGRMLRIFNSADASAVGGSGGGTGGELLQLQQSDGTHICTIGAGDYADIMFFGQSSPIELKKLKKHTVGLNNGDCAALETSQAPSVILPPITGVAFQVVSAKFVFSGTGMTMSSGTIDVKCNSQAVITVANTTITSAGTTIESAVQSVTPAANQAVTFDAGSDGVSSGSTDTALDITLFYYEI